MLYWKKRQKLLPKNLFDLTVEQSSNFQIRELYVTFISLYIVDGMNSEEIERNMIYNI